MDFYLALEQLDLDRQDLRDRELGADRRAATRPGPTSGLRTRLGCKRVILYSGTLGLKHDPGVIVQLASNPRPYEDVEIVVVSKAEGQTGSAGGATRRAWPTFACFLPAVRCPAGRAGKHILLTLLDADAGAFSVPSKVLSYLCAGRALLAAVPSDNLAAEVSPQERWRSPRRAWATKPTSWPPLRASSPTKAWWRNSPAERAGTPKSFDIATIRPIRVDSRSW